MLNNQIRPSNVGVGFAGRQAGGAGSMISIRDPPPCPLSGVPPQHTSGNEPESDMNTDTPGCSEAREVGGSSLSMSGLENGVPATAATEEPSSETRDGAGSSSDTEHASAEPAQVQPVAQEAPPPPPPSSSAPPDNRHEHGRSPENPDEDVELQRNIVRNLETGETFDIRQVDEHITEQYNLFPSRAELAARLATPRSDGDSDDDSTAAGGGGGSISSKLSNVLQFTGFRRPKKAPQESMEGNVRVNAVKKEAADFNDLRTVQCLQAHDGPVWTMKFSLQGQYLATAGQSGVVLVWLVGSGSKQGEEEEGGAGAEEKKGAERTEGRPVVDEVVEAEGSLKLLNPVPLRRFTDHTADVIDLSWNKEDFLLSASIDKSVRLWHVGRSECLNIFLHSDCVTSVDFHPTRGYQFVSGNFDKKLRIWSVPDARVLQYASTPDMITAACFNPEGTQAVAGLYRGLVFFYQTEGMRYYTQVECRNRHGALRGGKKVTGLCYDTSRVANESAEQLLITTNDSRLRLYQTEDYSMLCKYKGLVNDHMQIKATFSEDGAYVISGSENGNVYIWKATTPQSSGLAQSLIGFRRDRNTSYEFFNATEMNPNNPPIVTAAIFVPSTAVMLAAKGTAIGQSLRQDLCVNKMIVSADYSGKIRVFQRKALASSA